MRIFTARNLVRFGASVGAVAGVTFGLLPFQADINSTTVALAFLLVILVAATFFGRNPALVASVAAMLSFNYFFLPPLRTWSINGPQNFVAWFAFALTAIVAGELSAYARRRALEAESRQHEIERLYGELREAFEQASEAEALRRSERLKSSLLDAVTHDLRTPLTSIKASVTTLIDDRREGVLDDEGRAEFLDVIDEETDRLNEFIEGVVAMARIESDALTVRRKLFSPEEIVNNSLRRAKRRLANHRVETELADELPSLNVDGASLVEVFYTLLDNAAKYSADGTRIRITAHLAGSDRMLFAVEDQGRGIPPAMREKIFEKFYRASDAHETGSGLGLGLAIARGLLESQGGRIRVVDGGHDFTTRFEFDMPVGSAAGSADVPSASDETPQAAAEPGRPQI